MSERTYTQFDVWRNEVTFYPSDKCNVDDGAAFSVWEHKKGVYVLNLEEGWELVKNEDGYGNTYYTIKQVVGNERVLSSTRDKRQVLRKRQLPKNPRRTRY